MDRRDLLPKIEHRLYSMRLELREAGPDAGGLLPLSGYASVFDHGYEMFGGPPWPGWTEYVKPGAFTRTLKNGADVQLLVNHTGMPLARTKSGTMTLGEDATGLSVDAELEPSDPDVQRLAPKMRRRDMDEMSFAFRVIEDRWFNEDGEERDIDDTDAVVRHLIELSIHKGDVSVVNYGANDATSTQLNSIDRAVLELRAGRTIAPEARDALVARLGLTPPLPAAQCAHEGCTNPPTGARGLTEDIEELVCDEHVGPAPEEPHVVETLSLATALALSEADREAPAA